MDSTITFPCNSLVPKPLVILLTFVGFIHYGLSAVLFYIGLNPSFQEEPYPWVNPECTSSPPVAPSFIKRQLRAVKYSRLRDVDSESTSCSVCLCGLEARHVVRELGNCRHAFHKRCIDAWVDVGKVTCPLCRSQLLPAERRPEEGIRYIVNRMRKKLWG